MPSGPLVAWMNPLPIELTSALADRRRRLAATASGRVLDLGGWADHLDAYPDGDVDLLVDPGDPGADRGQGRVRRLDSGVDALVELGAGPYDTIVSLIRTPLVSDLGRYLGALRRLLAEDGWLLMLEPDRRTDTIGRLLTAARPLVRATSGLHLDRDIANAVRTAGFVVTDLHRFRVPTVAAPLRPFIEGRARVRAPR